MAIFNLNVNGNNYQVEVDPDTPILWVLRDELNLVGTKYGCGIGQCGACTIHVNGNALKSCSLPVSQLGDQAITTIEGLAENIDHPVQEAWKKHDVPQCGYCQAGQIMAAASFLEKNPNPTEEDVVTAMSGNICRCATYNSIKAAVMTASENM